MKIKEEKYCVRCGAKEKDNETCSAWGVSYKQHILTCESETKDSARCKICGELVLKTDIVRHHDTKCTPIDLLKDEVNKKVKLNEILPDIFPDK